MAPNPITPQPGTESPVAAARLLRAFGARGWTVGYHELLRYWSAEHVSTDGQHIRYLCARSAADLAGKLEAAETDEP